MKEITIRKPDDFHCHLRKGDLLKSVLIYTARQFGRVLAMPNINPPILTADDAREYEIEIKNALNDLADDVDSYKDFVLLKSIKLTNRTTPKIIHEAKKDGVLVGKAYPVGVTTNSDDGISEFQEMEDVFSAMQEVGMALSIHGEAADSSIPALKKEEEFLPILDWIVKKFLRLRIVLEHLSTEAAVNYIVWAPSNVVATITAHHLVLTLDDIIGGALQPHNFCKPIAKTKRDRDALIEAATSGNPKFFFGSDSAPHLKCSKETSAGAAGIFSAPVALPVLADVFEKAGCIENLENFVSVFGAQFYNLPLNYKEITLIKESWVVPTITSVSFFKMGEVMNWRVVQDEL